MSIYKLQCSDGHFYIGSTHQSLHKRLAGHKNLSKYSPSRVYQHIRQCGWENVTILLVEEVTEDIRIVENNHIQRERDNPLCLNCNSAVKNPEYHREYYQENKTDRLAYQNEWYANNKDKAKAYYERNKARIRDYQKAYVARRKEKQTAPNE